MKIYKTLKLEEKIVINLAIKYGDKVFDTFKAIVLKKSRKRAW